MPKLHAGARRKLPPLDEPKRRKRVTDGGHVLRAHLQQHPRLLGKKKGQRFFLFRYGEREATTARKRHLQRCNQRPPIRAIVIGHQEASVSRTAQPVNERVQARGIIQIGGVVPQLTKHLSKRAAAEPIPAGRQVHKQQHAGFRLQLRRKAEPDIINRHKGRNVQGDR